MTVVIYNISKMKSQSFDFCYEIMIVY